MSPLLFSSFSRFSRGGGSSVVFRLCFYSSLLTCSVFGGVFGLFLGGGAGESGDLGLLFDIVRISSPV